jgi:hypothetical protein
MKRVFLLLVLAALLGQPVCAIAGSFTASFTGYIAPGSADIFYDVTGTKIVKETDYGGDPATFTFSYDNTDPFVPFGLVTITDLKKGIQWSFGGDSASFNITGSYLNSPPFQGHDSGSVGIYDLEHEGSISASGSFDDPTGRYFETQKLLAGKAEAEYFSDFYQGDGYELVYIQAKAVGTPEPGSLTLLGLGTVSLAGYGWRRRKQAVTT